ncbi:MAG TPA: hypothetical protein VGS19_21370 [Streptosporangiaceae bacterium]|nr:hypothetical protein [Streptosporangiaceae bacterium]
MFRAFANWLFGPRRELPARRRSRMTGCLLWILGLIVLLVLLSLLFGGFQKGTKVGSLPAAAPALVSTTL